MILSLLPGFKRVWIRSVLFSKRIITECYLIQCPGFGQDRVNFHQNPGRGTARWADPTWPNRVGYSIPCAVMLGSGGEELGGRELTRSSGGHSDGLVRENGSVGHAVCVMFSPYLYRCCSCSLYLLFC